MIALVLYVPLAVALAVLLFYSTRGALRGSGNGRLIPFTLLITSALFGSLYLMFVAELPWAAVGLSAVVAVPVLTPITLLVVAVIISWLTGKPIRWN